MKMERENGCLELHVVMFPWFGFGHISPFIQLSNKLSSHGGVRISFFSAAGNIARISSSLNLGPNIQIIPLEIPRIQGLPQGLENTANMTPEMAELLKLALDQLQPDIESLLITLKPHFVFHDFAQHWIPSLGSKLGIKTFLLSVFSAVSSAFLTVPTRSKQSSSSLSLEEIMKKPPPGFPSDSSITSVQSFQARDFVYIFKSFNGSPSVYDRLLTILRDGTGIVIKTCNEMEACYINYLKSDLGKSVLLAGPVIPEPPTVNLDEKWAKWLGHFPSKSVIFCSFGSETFLSNVQIKELVLGLEQTGLPFFVVLNFPSEGEEKLKSVLPKRFEERVKDRGVIHTGWVQQQLILAHHSVGCFVCHSGFSSVTEALINDCQLVLLPMKGDQYLNAKLVSGDLKAGVEVIRNDEDGSFGKEDLCKAIKTVMIDVDKEPGRSIRENHKKWAKFFMNKDIHHKFISDLVVEMKKMVAPLCT